MRIPSLPMLIVIALFTDALCFDLKCIVNSPSTTIDICGAYDVKIQNQNDAITSINGKTDVSSVDAFTELIIHNQKVNFLPTNIATFFPKLEKLQIWNSGLEWIEQANIKDLTELKILDLENNAIEILENDLFEFNTKLQSITFRGNQLIFVHHRTFYELSALETLDLDHNECTKSVKNYDYDYESEPNLKNNPYGYRDDLSSFLETHCQSWEGAYNAYKKIFKRRIYDSQLKNVKVSQGLTHQLKTCGRNLDAVLANVRQQKLKTSSVVSINKPNDPPIINLKCEKNSCVAFDFQVSFANSLIQNDFYKTQTIESLRIHQQPTLFLPQNLGESFPQLIQLSVTESGLYEIASNVFVGLDLSSLNLTKNKIYEVPVDTFANLNNLKVLDLSFNKIESLFDIVFENLSGLQKLYLNNNYLTSIRVEVVKTLKSLNALHLQGNRLKFISAALLTPLTNLKSIDLSDNECINIDHPSSALLDIETTIIDNCTAPVEFSCKTENVENKSYCYVEYLFIEYPKTKISLLQKTQQVLNELIIVFIVEKQSTKFFPFQLSPQFPNLERIEIQQSNLTALHEGDFEGFSKLTEIIINNNNLSSISNGTFNIIPQLELLDLSSNGITALPRNIFAKLTRLHTLILSNNHIVQFMADYLPRKNVIHTFRVDNNQLEFIETKTIRFLRRAKLIDLRGNACIDMQFATTENRTRALVELSGEIDLSCAADE